MSNNSSDKLGKKKRENYFRKPSLLALEQSYERSGQQRNSEAGTLQQQLQQLRFEYESTVPL